MQLRTQPPHLHLPIVHSDGNNVAHSKVYRVYRGDVSKLTDVVRCQVVSPDLLKIEQFLEHLQRLHKESSLEVLRIRNRLDDDYPALALTGG